MHDMLFRKYLILSLIVSENLSLNMHIRVLYIRPHIKMNDKLAILRRLIAKDRVSCTQASGAKLRKRLNPLWCL